MSYQRLELNDKGLTISCGIRQSQEKISLSKNNFIIETEYSKFNNLFKKFGGWLNFANKYKK